MRSNSKLSLPQVETPSLIPPSTEVVEVSNPSFEPSGMNREDILDQVRARLRTVYDPEIPLNIFDLGLIYHCGLTDEHDVDIEMTLTAPACPAADTIVKEVADKVASFHEVARCRVHLVWDPPWTKERMSEEALLELGL